MQVGHWKVQVPGRDSSDAIEQARLFISGAIVLSIINNYLIPDVINGVPGDLGLDFDMTQITFAVYGFLLLIMMILRPQGLLPDRRHKMELVDQVETTDDTLYTARA